MMKVYLIICQLIYGKSMHHQYGMDVDYSVELYNIEVVEMVMMKNIYVHYKLILLKELYIYIQMKVKQYFLHLVVLAAKDIPH